MKPNHHSLAYKQQKQPNKTYKDLKQKQKMKIADWMFRETCIFYKENGELPGDSEKMQALAEALQSDTVKQFIEETYKGAVVATY